MCINVYATEPSLGKLVIGPWRLDVDAYLEKAPPEQDREFKRKFRDLVSDVYVIIKENMFHMYNPGEEARSIPYTVLLEDEEQHQLLIEILVHQKERMVGKIVISDQNHIVFKGDKNDKEMYLVRAR